MATVNEKTEYARAEREILSRIAKQSLPAGGQLPPMRKLCDEINVSMITLRRAISNLKKKGRLTSRRGSGVYVANPGRHLVVESEILPAIPGHRTICLVGAFAEGDYVNSVGTDIVASELISGLMDCCVEHQFGLRQLSFVFDKDGGGQEALSRVLEAKDETTVLIATPHFLPFLTDLEQGGGSYLVLAPQGPSSVRYEVRADLSEGGFLAGQYLAGLGHRSIMYIGTDPLASKSTFDRHAGFCFGCRSEEPSAQLVEIFVPVVPDKHDYERVFRSAAERALLRIAEVSAVFIASDYIASVVISFLLQHGVRVPQTISLVTLDDSKFCRQFTPPWTSVNLNYRQVAVTAVELVASWENGQPRPEFFNAVVPPRLVVRESCRPAGGDRNSNDEESRAMQRSVHESGRGIGRVEQNKSGSVTRRECEVR